VGIAQFLEHEHPDLIVSEMAKAKRKGKVFFSHSPKETLSLDVFGRLVRPDPGSVHINYLCWRFLRTSKEAAEKR
jgi:hypothetical protein